MKTISTKNKAIAIIILTSIAYLFQVYLFETKGSDVLNLFLLKHTINPENGWGGIFDSMFLHANLIHLGMNMFMFYILSTMFNENSKIVLIYLLSGMLSGLFSVIYVNYISPAYVLGASGAIFGIFSYIFFKTNRRKEFYLNFFIFNGLMIILNLGVAWYAHLGGAIAGILYYYYENDIMPKIRRKRMRKI